MGSYTLTCPLHAPLASLSATVLLPPPRSARVHASDWLMLRTATNRAASLGLPPHTLSSLLLTLHRAHALHTKRWITIANLRSIVIIDL